jgi:hypothetical protein
MTAKDAHGMTYTSDVLPGPDDIAFYRAHGYWISPEIVPHDVLDAAEHGMARYYAGDLDTPDDNWSAPPATGLRKNDYASLHITELSRLVAQPLIAATAAALSGADTVRLWHDQLLQKPVDRPGTAANVGWHTDRQYWQSCTSESMLTAWVGFHDVDATGGSVSFLAGSHRWDVSGLNFFAQDLDALEAEITGQGHRLDIRPTRMKRGQVSFHHCRTVHGSGPNLGTEPRRSLAIHLQPGDNRCRPGIASSHGNDALVRLRDGVPDYTDPEVCPQLWPAPLNG